MIANTPQLWAHGLPRPTRADHKYTRGQVAVLGGADMTGAACLAAEAAARIGAGLVMIVSPFFDFPKKAERFDPIPIYHSFRPYLIIREHVSFLDVIREGERKGRIIPVLGPGLGNDTATIRRIVLGALRRGKPVVLDADALNAFEGAARAELCAALHENANLPPHQGEFARLFPETAGRSRVEKMAHACAATPGVWVLKGGCTLIAARGTEVMENDTASPYLATAGAGDVLAGMIAGLLAQGMAPLDAACAGVWMHGRAGAMLGPGLVASDLAGQFPAALQEVLGFQDKVG
jgi:hydroxyethylthiazole kinase-like uncharacterized protein yjeF